MSRLRRWLLLASFASACATTQVQPGAPSETGANRVAAAPAPLRIHGPEETTHEAATEAVILKRLEQTVAEVPAGAMIPRMGLADIAIPASQSELEALGGFAVVFVTAIVNDPNELPIVRVEARIDETKADLIPVITRKGVIPDSLTPTLGRHRQDGAYLIPMFVTRARSVVIVHLRGDSRPLEVLHFPAPPGEATSVDALSITGEIRDPNADVLERVIVREFPVMKDALPAGGLGRQ